MRRQITLEMTEIQKRIRVLEQETAALEEAFHAAENALSAANEAVKAAAQQMFAAKEAKNALGTAPEKDLPQSKAELDAKSTETQTLSVQLGRFAPTCAPLRKAPPPCSNTRRKPPRSTYSTAAQQSLRGT